MNNLGSHSYRFSLFLQQKAVAGSEPVAHLLLNLITIKYL